MTRPQLTHREDEVLHLAIAGLGNDEIAARLAISRRTVEAHMRTLFRKTGVTRRAQLAAFGTADSSATSPLQQGRDLEDCRRQLRVYAAAVRGLVDRQFPLFEERVEITVLVGDQDGQDAVVERRWTRPRPYLVYRVLCPIVPWPEGAFELDDLAPACKVDRPDLHVDVHVVRDVDGRPLVMILFQPGLQDDTEWELRYRSPQLWTPLRNCGQDTLTWATATLDQRHPPTIDDLTLKVVFPLGWTGEQVTEQSNLGLLHTECLPTGQTQVTWRQETPDAGSYHWTLQGRAGPS